LRLAIPPLALAEVDQARRSITDQRSDI
jgi:hypothetical protein